jgi:hypothetical protein
MTKTAAMRAMPVGYEWGRDACGSGVLLKRPVLKAGTDVIESYGNIKEIIGACPFLG